MAICDPPPSDDRRTIVGDLPPHLAQTERAIRAALNDALLTADGLDSGIVTQQEADRLIDHLVEHLLAAGVDIAEPDRRCHGEGCTRDAVAKCPVCKIQVCSTGPN